MGVTDLAVSHAHSEDDAGVLGDEYILATTRYDDVLCSMSCV